MVEENNPLVSINVITYNSSKFVLETLESAKAQTYQNIELIVSDDCSTDNTVEICKEWIEKNKDRFVRTELITVEKNTGIAANCNRAVKASKGEWIKGIAGDDILLPHCVDDNVNYAIANNADFVFSDIIQFDNSGIIITKSIYHQLFFEFVKMTKRSKLKFYSRIPIFLNTPSWFYYNENKKIYDETYLIVEDQPLVFNMINDNKKIVFLDKETIKYRKHEGSVLISMNYKSIIDFHKCFKEYRIKYLSVINIIDFMFILNYYITYIYYFAAKNIFTKLIIYPITKLNPVNLFKISSTKGLKFEDN